MPIAIAGLDHFVLTVADIDRTCAFYETVLGMRRIAFGEGRHALAFGSQKINLHQVGNVIDPLVRHATAGSGDLCFYTDTPMAEVERHLALCGVKVIRGPGERHGAIGKLNSVYVYDPDENLVEIANRL